MKLKHYRRVQQLGEDFFVWRRIQVLYYEQFKKKSKYVGVTVFPLMVLHSSVSKVGLLWSGQFMFGKFSSSFPSFSCSLASKSAETFSGLWMIVDWHKSPLPNWWLTLATTFPLYRATSSFVIIGGAICSEHPLVGTSVTSVVPWEKQEKKKK